MTPAQYLHDQSVFQNTFPPRRGNYAYADASLEVAKDNEVQRALKARDAANTDDVESWRMSQAGSCLKLSTALPPPRVRVQLLILLKQSATRLSPIA
jgi:hypothetical protein